MSKTTKPKMEMGIKLQEIARLRIMSPRTTKLKLALKRETHNNKTIRMQLIKRNPKPIKIKRMIKKKNNLNKMIRYKKLINLLNSKLLLRSD